MTTRRAASAILCFTSSFRPARESHSDLGVCHLDVPGDPVECGGDQSRHQTGPRSSHIHIGMTHHSLPLSSSAVSSWTRESSTVPSSPTTTYPVSYTHLRAHE